MNKIGYILIPLIVFLVATIGSFFTGTGMDWYDTINLPSWTPPGYFIGIVWTIIFLLSTISALIVWGKPRNWLVITVFLINAFLNVFWSYLFFNQHLIGAAFFEAIILDVTVFILIFKIWPISRLASMLLIPYGLWGAFASFLTLVVWILN
jgi:tryptophan-rich sensory protein